MNEIIIREDGQQKGQQAQRGNSSNQPYSPKPVVTPGSQKPAR